MYSATNWVNIIPFSSRAIRLHDEHKLLYTVVVKILFFYIILRYFYYFTYFTWIINLHCGSGKYSDYRQAKGVAFIYAPKPVVFPSLLHQLLFAVGKRQIMKYGKTWFLGTLESWTGFLQLRWTWWCWKTNTQRLKAVSWLLLLLLQLFPTVQCLLPSARLNRGI